MIGGNMEDLYLLYYVKNNDTNNVLELLNLYTPNVNIRDNEGQTPLHIAVRLQNVEIVRALVNHGANIEAEDADGLIPYAYAWPNPIIMSLVDVNIPDYVETNEEIDISENKMTREELLEKIKRLCFNESDPVSMNDYEDMPIDKLRKVYYLSNTANELIEKIGDIVLKGHCFEKDTLKKLLNHNNWINPLTREPLNPELRDKINSKAYGGNRKINNNRVKSNKNK